ncbi:hypothetical protein LIER_09730 [Lithospermum erythrorhizon]|uniref:Uncharacterized protein n=1 Tax=Lithospermum erythrorhizon TaxID=34254 RepID=A0AAV3PGQ0_LITER
MADREPIKPPPPPKGGIECSLNAGNVKSNTAISFAQIVQSRSSKSLDPSCFSLKPISIYSLSQFTVENPRWFLKRQRNNLYWINFHMCSWGNFPMAGRISQPLKFFLVSSSFKAIIMSPNLIRNICSLYASSKSITSRSG